ncbi:cyclic nucleotide-binding domain-containing protein [bacterium]|nr:cyclic nucleotide-binding domain-containing protein [bacterium]
MTATINDLRVIELFAGISDDDLEVVRKIALVRQYTAGERVFSLGDDARTLLVVTAGTIALTIPIMLKDALDDIALEEKGPGSVIAWSALVPPHKFTLGATSKTAAELHCFDREAIERLFAERPHLHPVIIGNLNRVIASRVTLLEALVARNLQRWVAERYQ